MYTELLQACFDHDSPESASRALLAEANALLIDRRAGAGYEQADLLDRWGQAFDELELLLALCESLGRSYDERHADDPRAHGQSSFVVLARLSFRSYQVGGEILALLKAGHASGAFARWRTLHEIDIVARFIAEHGDEVAERFLAHEEFRRRGGRHDLNRLMKIIGVNLPAREMWRMREEDEA